MCKLHHSLVDAYHNVLSVLGVHRTEQNFVEVDNPVSQGTAEEERIGRYTLSTKK